MLWNPLKPRGADGGLAVQGDVVHLRFDKAQHRQQVEGLRHELELVGQDVPARADASRSGTRPIASERNQLYGVP